MKYLIFGDIHGKDLKKLEKRILAEQPDALICLGDFDHVNSIREFMDIEESMLKNGKKVYKVPGNHDYSVLHGNSLGSNTLETFEKKVPDHYRDLNKDKKARDYLFNFVNSDLFARGFLDEEKFGKKYPFVVVHGGYLSDVTRSNLYSDDLKPMWVRMKSDGIFYDNMGEMLNKGEKIMIRGHDHEPTYSRMNFETGERETSRPVVRGTKFNINPEKQHIINPGPYFYRDYATIDTSGEVPELEFKKDLDGTSYIDYLNL